jgi:hypothetical protein
MTHREPQAHAKITLPVVPERTGAPVTMSGDPVFDSLTNDGAPIEDVAQEILGSRLAVFAQSFLAGE